MGRAAGDDVPRYPPTILADKTCGITFAFSTLSALMHRQRTGEGQFVEVPMFETMAAWLMVEHLWERTSATRARSATRACCPHPQALPHARRLDGDPALQRQALAQLLRADRPARGAEGPALLDPNARSLHIKRMYSMVEALTPSRTTGEWGRPARQGTGPGNAPYRSRPIFSRTRTWCERELIKSTRIPAEG
jgi:crotonobetainyl-CoA:carnitine CoA-transferase CaiB-like acyl-CoA transferase